MNAKKPVASLVVLLTVTCLVVSSCAPTPIPQTSAPSVSTQAAPASQSAATPPAAPAADAELAPYLTANIDWKQCAGEKLNIAFIDYYDPQLIKEQVPLFEKLTGISVNFELLPEDEFNQKTYVDLASGAGQYDVVQQFALTLPQYAEGGFLEPLDQYLSDPKMTDPKWFDFADIMKPLVAGSTFNGKLYMMPHHVETVPFMYRKDLLQKAGLPVPDNFEQLTAAAKALNNPPSQYGIGLRGLRGFGSNVYIFSVFFNGYGASYFKDYPNDMTPVVDSAKAIEATKYYVDLLKTYGPPDVANWSWAEVLAGLMEGRVGMSIDASDFGPQLETQGKSKTVGLWGYSLPPAGPETRFTPISSIGVVIPKASKNKCGAWLFSQYVVSKPAYDVRFPKAFSTSRTSVWTNPEYKKIIVGLAGEEYYSALTRAFNEGRIDFIPLYKGTKELGDKIGIELQAALAGQKTPEQAMKDLKVEMEKMAQ